MFSYFSKNKHTKRIIPKSATKQKLLSFKKIIFKKDNANNFLLMDTICMMNLMK